MRKSCMQECAFFYFIQLRTGLDLAFCGSRTNFNWFPIKEAKTPSTYANNLIDPSMVRKQE